MAFDRPITRRSLITTTTLSVLGGSGAFLTACGGGGGGTVKLTRAVTGQVLIEAWIQLPKDSMDAIKKDHLAELVSYNIGINDEKSCLTLSPKPYPGVWIRLGKTVVMADKEGKFELPIGAEGSKIEVLREVNSIDYEYSADAAIVNSSDSITMTVAYLHQGGNAMAAKGRSVDPSCHTQGTSRSRAEERCKSWDGYWPATPDTPQTDPAGLRAYIGSTCWKLVDSGLCANEGNVIKNYVRGIPGPKCKPNHGGRYCQEVDPDDFDLSAPDSVKTGDKIQFTIRNNTASIISTLKASHGGRFSNVEPYVSQRGPLELDILHSDVVGVQGNEPKYVHHVARTVAFDSTGYSGPITFTAKSGGITKTKEVLVEPKNDTVKVTFGFVSNAWFHSLAPMPVSFAITGLSVTPNNLEKDYEFELGKTYTVSVPIKLNPQLTTDEVDGDDACAILIRSRSGDQNNVKNIITVSDISSSPRWPVGNIGIDGTSVTDTNLFDGYGGGTVIDSYDVAVVSKIRHNSSVRVDGILRFQVTVTKRL